MLRRRPLAGKPFPESSEEHGGDHGRDLLRINRLAEHREMIGIGLERARPDGGRDFSHNGIVLGQASAGG